MTVYLVGAGPGDPGLLTVRGAEVLGRADVVVYDRLSIASLLDLAPPAAERISVGKTPRGPSTAQDEINRLLVEHGRTGATVVRLKGGDPFVFARGGEEAAALAAAGVPFEIVPGITSAVAVPAYAGVPVTHRGVATSFTVVTGHQDPWASTETDWDAVARVGGTIVVLMGVATRGEIARRLMAAGVAGSTPVCAVQWGTRPAQRTVRTTLEDLGAAAVESPAVIVIGEVAALDLAWFERRPLFGRRVVVTRAASSGGTVSALLADAGADVVAVPTIAFADADDGGTALAAACGRLSSYAWVVFTSATAVGRVMALVRDARAFGAAKVAAVGSATAAALRAAGVEADLVPDTMTAAGLVDAFPPAPAGAAAASLTGPADGDDGPDGDGDDGVDGEGEAVSSAASAQVLLPLSALAATTAADGLRAKGWRPHVVDAYTTVPATVTDAQRAAASGADAICFTSASTVRNWVTAAGVEATPPVVVTIGPATTAAARDAGLDVAAEAEEQSLAALVDALTAHLAT